MDGQAAVESTLQVVYTSSKIAIPLLDVELFLELMVTSIDALKS